MLDVILPTDPPPDTEAFTELAAVVTSVPDRVKGIAMDAFTASEVVLVQLTIRVAAV
ncbi:MAG: hypothetical protein ABL933_06515 [Methyloglobulus sp.]|nr:hypothetical protein [Methyloglobulus sp.]